MNLPQIKKLTVKFNGRVVGYLADLENGIGFQYDESWLAEGFSISPFSLPLSSKVYVCNKPTFNGLYGVFADSLPDGWGELLFRRMLARQGVNADRVPSLTRLALVNERGLGGLQYEPNISELDDDERFDLDVLSAESAKIWGDEKNAANLDEIFRFGGSSGGARPKAHVKIQDDYWIVKFPCSVDPKNIGKQEYDANRLAQKAGINVNEFKLFPSKTCKGFFGAKRFDRVGNARVHVASLSSLLETSHRIPNLDYSHLMQVVQRICVCKDDLYEVFRRMCFNVFFGNRDDHGKNFAFFYDERVRGYRISPAYDITKTMDKPEHEMSVNGNGKPTAEDLLAVAKNASLQMERCKGILEAVRNCVALKGKVGISH